MAIYFRKRIKIIPGVYMNIGKKSTSFSVGPRGAKLNFGKNGTYINAGIQGTGIYARTKISGANKKNKISKEEKRQIENESINKNPLRFILIFLSFWLAVFLPLFFDASWIWFPIFVVIGICCAFIPDKKEDNSEELSQGDIENDKTEIYESIDDFESAMQTSKEVEDVGISETLKNIPFVDPLFEDAAKLVVGKQQASTYLVHRTLSVGYSRAGRLMEQLEKAGVVGPISGAKPRNVLCKNMTELALKIKELDNNVFEEIEINDKTEEKNTTDLESCSRLIKLGVDLEKEGMIEEAIKAYEKAIIPKLPAKHPYERLAVLYRKKKDYENEIRVIKIAIDVFMKENERRAGRIIEEDNSMYQMVMQALETNESIRYDDGKWAFVQYDVMDYITRLEKAKKLLERSSLRNK